MSYISLYNSCVITKGKKRACLMDLERATYCVIPNELYEVLKEKCNISLFELKVIYKNEEFEVLNKYLSFLEKNKFIKYHEEFLYTEYLPDSSFHNSFKIEDLIIDIDCLDSFIRLKKLIPNNIENVQLRIFYRISTSELKQIVNFFNYNGNINIELVLNHNKKNKEANYISLFKSYKIISRLVISDFYENKHLLYNQIICLKEGLKAVNQCGIISEKLFYPNLRTYLTSKSCNSCLNRKISIDIDGEIKNCPSMSQSFGNIKDTTLQEALNHKDFKKYWSITKDEIEVCKDCEFRYVCTDCRAYKENPKDDYSKPLKCGYSPYTNEWEEWSTNPLKQKTIKYYGMQELVKKNG